MSNTAVQLDGKGQYLGRIETTTTFGVYNAGIYNRGIYNFPINIEIGNVWTLGFWVKPRGYKEHGTIFAMGDKEGKNEILISCTPVPFESPVLGKRPAELRVQIKDANGTTIKHYGWGNFFQADIWTHTTVQWDGTTLNAFKNGLVTATGVVVADNSGTMADFPGRKVFYGSSVAGEFATFSGIVGHFGMWNSTLSGSELETVVSGGFDVDLTIASGSYTSQEDLRHYWKPGDDNINLGKDFTTSGTPLDLDRQRNLTPDNIILDAP